MIQIQVLSGKQAGGEIVVRRFPFVVGRAADAMLRLEDAGIWDQHFEVDFDLEHGFIFQVQPGATTLVNHERVERGILRNGDLIELASVQLRFWLAVTQQRGTRLREALTWAALVSIFGAQIALIYRLLQ